MDDDDDALKGQEPTPRASQEQWGLTPSLLDPNSFAFSSLASQPPAYYAAATPSASGLSSQPRQSNDFPTPNMPLNLLTPLINANPTSVDPSNIANPSIDMSALQQSFVPQIGSAIDPFAQQNSFSPGSLFQRSSDLTIDNADDASFGNYKFQNPSLTAANASRGLGENPDNSEYNNEE